MAGSVKRHGDNDELLAVVGYLDTSVVQMDLLSREAQPEAIERALAAFEKATKDQAAATAPHIGSQHGDDT